MNSPKNKSKAGIVIVVVFVAALVISALAFLRQGTGIAFLDNIFARKATASGSETQATQQQSKEDSFYKLGETYEKNGFRYTVRSVEKIAELPASLEKSKMPDNVDEITGSDYTYLSIDAEIESLKSADTELEIGGAFEPCIISNLSDPLYKSSQGYGGWIVYFSAAEHIGQNYFFFTLKAGEQKEVKIYCSVPTEELDNAAENGDSKLFIRLGQGSNGTNGQALVEVDHIIPDSTDFQSGVPTIYKVGETCEAGGLRLTLDSVTKTANLPSGFDLSKTEMGYAKDYSGSYLCVTMTVENAGSAEVQKLFPQIMNMKVIKNARERPIELSTQFAFFYTNKTRDNSSAGSFSDLTEKYKYIRTYRFGAGGKETIQAYYEIASNLTEDRLQDALSGGDRRLYVEVGKGIEDISMQTKVPWQERTLFEVDGIGG